MAHLQRRLAFCSSWRQGGARAGSVLQLPRPAPRACATLERVTDGTGGAATRARRSELTPSLLGRCERWLGREVVSQGRDRAESSAALRANTSTRAVCDAGRRAGSPLQRQYMALRAALRCLAPIRPPARTSSFSTNAAPCGGGDAMQLWGWVWEGQRRPSGAKEGRGEGGSGTAPSPLPLTPNPKPRSPCRLPGLTRCAPFPAWRACA